MLSEPHLRCLRNVTEQLVSEAKSKKNGSLAQRSKTRYSANVSEASNQCLFKKLNLLWNLSFFDRRRQLVSQIRYENHAFAASDRDSL